MHLSPLFWDVLQGLLCILTGVNTILYVKQSRRFIMFRLFVLWFCERIPFSIERKRVLTARILNRAYIELNRQTFTIRLRYQYLAVIYKTS